MSVYLDYAATTPVRPEIRERLDALHGQALGNPSSLHRAGHRARMVLEQAREECAQALGAQVEEIVFTSGATEANNLALAGWMRQQPAGSRCLISAVEHPSVYDCAQALELEGYGVELLPVDRQGQVSVSHVLSRLGPEVSMVAIMAVNNEVGAVQPIAELAGALKERKLLLHVDAVQAPLAVGLPDLRGIDLLSLSGHKLGAPVGCGLLYVRQGIRLAPLLVGGSQEDSRRAGTSNVAGAVALAQALQLASRERSARQDQLTALRDQLEEGLRNVTGAHLLAGEGPRSPHISAWLFEDILAEPLLVRLDMLGIYASSGSACSSHSLEPSRVVEAMLGPGEQNRGLIRFSLGAQTSQEEIDKLLQVLPGEIRATRGRAAA